MKVCFIAAGPIAWASSRMRAFWVAEEMPDAEVILSSDVMAGRPVPLADVYIFQKSIRCQMVEKLKYRGASAWWDVCDPSWWWEPNESLRIADLVDGVVASNEVLARDFTEHHGRECHTIPDRLKLAHFDKQRQHADVSPVRFIWYGIVPNRVSLPGALVNLERLTANGHEIELTIMDQQPERHLSYMQHKFPVTYVRWSLEREVEIISRHDIALLPPYPGPWGRVKSNNKELTAWACGLPVDDGQSYRELEEMVQSWQLRDSESRLVFKPHAHSVDKSASDWLALLEAAA